MREPGYSDMVRRDVRTFAVSALLLLAALACLALWALGVLEHNGRVATLSLGLLAFLISFVGWVSGDTGIRDRLFVLGPALGAAVPIGVGLGGPIGLAASFALALLATWAFVMSRRRGGQVD